MLVILTTHPIQYQVPLWQDLAKDGRVPFEVWYLTHHAVKSSRDAEFGKEFAWDLDMLAGYPSRVIPTAPGATPTSFAACRVTEPLADLLRNAGARAVWIQGWQVLAYWQAALNAKRVGCELWLRAESNDLAPVAWWKKPIKRFALFWLFARVDRFFCIGTANARLYRKFGIPDSRLLSAPYAVDNDRFRVQADRLRPHRTRIRREWGIAEDAFCAMFCGKFVPKKHPLALIEAAKLAAPQAPSLHLLFVGSGELGDALRLACDIAFDAEAAGVLPQGALKGGAPRASFTGFLNQTEISRAYVAADSLVLTSDFGETWGLVVNEAMASGLPCIVSDRCGCAADLGQIGPNDVFPFGDITALSESIIRASRRSSDLRIPAERSDFSFARTVESVIDAYTRQSRGGCIDRSGFG